MKYWIFFHCLHNPLDIKEEEPSSLSVFCRDSSVGVMKNIETCSGECLQLLKLITEMPGSALKYYTYLNIPGLC